MFLREQGEASMGLPHFDKPTTKTLLSVSLLNEYLDRNISEICPHGYADDSLNHCAHFVCHVASLATGAVTCRQMSGGSKVKNSGVCIRVHELFHACPAVGEFDEATPAQKESGVFVFVTSPTAVKLATKTMTNLPKKHVGIFHAGTIWHYSNTKDKVVTATPAEFKSHYKSQTNGLYFGTLPKTAVVVRFGNGL